MMVTGECDQDRDVTSKLDLRQNDMRVIDRFAKLDTATVCAVMERFAGIDRTTRSTTPGDAGARTAAPKHGGYRHG
jgi:hypothetical protein